MADITSYQMLIDGEWVDAADGGTFDSVNPADGKVWSRVPEATEADVNRAVEAAHTAFTTGPWAGMTPTERGKCLRKLGDLLADHSEGLGRTESVDTGKMLKETRWQAKYIAEFFHFFAGCADKVSGETLPIDKPDMFVFTKREPLGVVAAVVPWNSQLFLVAVKLGPALAAGNTVVLKASEHASAAMLEFGKLIEQAGIPPGVVNIVTGHGEPCGRALTSHPLVARVSFTGGPNAARHVLENVKRNFAEVSLELGGKSPFIVFDDANIESAVNASIAGIFGATGQSCVAGSRLYLHEDIADEFLEQMTAQARARLSSVIHWRTKPRWVRCAPPASWTISSARLPMPRKRVARFWWAVSNRTACRGCFTNPRLSNARVRICGLSTRNCLALSCPSNASRPRKRCWRLPMTANMGWRPGIFTKDIRARSLRMANSVRAGIVWVNTYRRGVADCRIRRGSKAPVMAAKAGFRRSTIIHGPRRFG